MIRPKEPQLFRQASFPHAFCVFREFFWTVGPQYVSKIPREAEVTRDSLLTKLEKAFTVAEKAKNGSAMTMSVMGMARICGLIIDRREVGEAGAFADMTDEQLLQEALDRARRLGLAGPAEVIQLTPKSG